MQILFAIVHAINSFINLFSFVSERSIKNKNRNLAHDSEIKGKYILRQSTLGYLLYGKKSISYNGCGIIALHNILLYLKKERPFSETVCGNEKNAVLSGLFGLSPYGMKKYLASQGLHIETFGKKHISSEKLSGKAFIHFYFRKNLSAHYVAAIPEKTGHRFLNSSVRNIDAVSIEEYRKHIKKEGVIYECVYAVM